jgi:bifunctional DNase/RNase
MSDTEVTIKVAKKIIVDKKPKGILILECRASGKILSMEVPAASVDRIDAALNKVEKERPDMHDLTSSLMRSMDLTLQRVVLKRSMEADVYDAHAYVTRVIEQDTSHSQYVVLEGRPSDLIPLAIILDTPIATEEALLHEPEGPTLV